MQQTIRVWDLPTRVFHWTLFVLVGAAFLTGELGGNLIVWHGRIGLAIAGLLAFRLVWGLIGSTYARFANFIPGPGRVLAYLRGEWHGLGHNPIGALSVLALLGLVAFQVMTGLFGNDEIAFSGPLSVLVSEETSNWLTGLHKLGFNLLLALVVLHVGAMVFYARVKKEDLLMPMITGVKTLEDQDPTARPAQGGGLIAFLVAVAIAGGVVWAANGGLLAPPPPAVATPAW